MGFSGLSSENMRPATRKSISTGARNRRSDYLRRVAQAPDARMRVARATEAVRAAAKDLSEADADRVVSALLALAGLSANPTANQAAAQLLQLSGA